MGIRERFHRHMLLKASFRGDFRKLLRDLESQGWRIEMGEKKYKAWPPDKSKPMVTMSKTPSDIHALNQMIRQLRDSGYVPGGIKEDEDEEETERDTTLSDVVGKPQFHGKDYAEEQARDKANEMVEFLFDEVASGAPKEEIHQVVDMINEEQIKQ